jgi:hypothetical protein
MPVASHCKAAAGSSYDCAAASQSGNANLVPAALTLWWNSNVWWDDGSCIRTRVQKSHTRNLERTPDRFSIFFSGSPLKALEREYRLPVHTGGGR